MKMTKIALLFCLFFLFAIVMPGVLLAQKPIDRKALVERHTITVNTIDSLNSLSVGNGRFAFTVDATGLQTFPDEYAHGVSLGTESEWGWHSFPNVHGYKLEEALKTYHLNGRDVTYTVQWNTPPEKKAASDYFRINVHRLQLGNIGLDLLKKNGQPATINDIKGITQTLNMYTGEIHSRFMLEDAPVEVITYAHQQQDAVATRIVSPLIQAGRLMVRLRFPYPSGEWFDAGNNWKDEDKHTSSIVATTNGVAMLQHTLDTTTYYVGVSMSLGARVEKKQAHYFQVKPAAGNSFECSFHFAPSQQQAAAAAYKETVNSSTGFYAGFWKTSGVVDFTGSTDNRAFELERRIVCSQYLTKIQCAGSQPPQETGLTYNSWYGKPHLEMHWWHGIHFGLWNHIDLLEQSLAWYKKVAHNGRAIAQRQGYEGIRWQKMTDNEGRESPSSIGAMLIWQQPHFIYMTELVRRMHNDQQTLDRYKDLVFATADFMASFAYYDSARGHYILGPGVIPAQERFKPEQTFNPTYELVYWRWALETAQQWRLALHMERNAAWDDVIQKLAPLPVQDGLYLPAESATDGYTDPKYRTDHPSVLGALGMMPLLPCTDTAIMHNTFNWIWNNWTWDDTWGWDFPMVAMTATRLGLPDRAIDALFMPVHTNTWLVSGHNYQDQRLTIYLPGNGGLLAAIAMMCAGYDGATTNNPGFPKNGKWTVRWEGLQKMP